DPPIAQFLFQNTKASIIWLVVRLYVAYGFLEAGWHKFNDPAWMGDGSGILGFWTRAAGVGANGQPVIAYGWYRAFIQSLIDSNAAPWFAKTILLPLDGSALAERAIPYAASIARRSGARVVLVEAVLAHTLPGIDPSDAQLDVTDRAQGSLRTAVTRLEAAGVEAEPHVYYD